MQSSFSKVKKKLFGWYSKSAGTQQQSTISLKGVHHVQASHEQGNHVAHLGPKSLSIITAVATTVALIAMLLQGDSVPAPHSSPLTQNTSGCTKMSYVRSGLGGSVRVLKTSPSASARSTTVCSGMYVKGGRQLVTGCSSTLPPTAARCSQLTKRSGIGCNACLLCAAENNAYSCTSDHR